MAKSAREIYEEKTKGVSGNTGTGSTSTSQKKSRSASEIYYSMKAESDAAKKQKEAESNMSSAEKSMQEAQTKTQKAQQLGMTNNEYLTYTDTKTDEAKAMKEKIGLDSLYMDIVSSGNGINDFVNSVQNGQYIETDTMKSYVDSANDIVDRLNTYFEYSDRYGGLDDDSRNYLNNIYNAYAGSLDTLNAYSNYYGQYGSNANYEYLTGTSDEDLQKEYDRLKAATSNVLPDSDYYYSGQLEDDKARLNSIGSELQRRKNQKNYEISEANGFSGLDYDEVQKLKANYAEGSDEYNYLDQYGVNAGYSDLRDYDKELAGVDPKSEYGQLLQAERNKYALDNSFDLYKDKAELAKNSEISYLNGTNDKTYEYLNLLKTNPNEAKVYAYENDLNLEQQKLENLTDEEIDTYLYIYQTEGKEAADKMISDMQVTADKRNINRIEGQIEDAYFGKMDENGVRDASTAEDFSDFTKADVFLANVGLSLAGGLSAGIGNIQNFASYLKGDGFNSYISAYDLNSLSQKLSQVQQQDVMNYTEQIGAVAQNLPIVGNLWSSLVGWTFSALQSDAGGRMSQLIFNNHDKVAGAAYTILMGMGAMATSARELQERGLSDDQIAWTSLANGICEAAFEYLPTEALLTGSKTNSWKGLFKNVLGQTLEEGLEELFTEEATWGIDQVINGTLSGYAESVREYMAQGYGEDEARELATKDHQNDVANAFIGGAASGGMSAGIYSTASFASNSRQGANARRMGITDELYRQALMASPESNTGKYMAELQSKGVNEGNYTDAQIGYLINSPDTVKDSQSGFEDYVKKQQLRNKAAESVLSERSDLGNRTDLSESLSKNNEAQNDKINQYLIDEAKIQRTLEGDYQQILDKSRKYQHKIGTKIGNDEKITSVVTGEDGKQTIVTDKGEYSASKLNLSDNQAAIVAIASSLDTKEESDLFLKNYDGKQNPLEYREAFRLAYYSGSTGVNTLEQVLNTVKSMSPEAVSNIYSSGRSEKSKANVRVMTESIKDHIAKSNKKTTAGMLTVEKGSGIDLSNFRVRDYTENNTPYTRRMTNDEIMSISAARTVAEICGYQLELFNSKTGYEKYGDSQGMYFIGKNKIRLDVYAGVYGNGENSGPLYILSHEMTHYAEERTALWEDFKNTTLQMLVDDKDYLAPLKEENKNFGIEDIVNYEILRTHSYKSVMERDALLENEENRKEAESELVARACEDMLKNSELFNKAINKMDSDTRSGFLAHLKKIIGDIISAFKEMLSRTSSVTAEAKAINQNIDLLKKWEAMIDDAIKNNREMGGMSVSTEIAELTSEDDQVALEAGITALHEGNSEAIAKAVGEVDTEAVSTKDEIRNSRRYDGNIMQMAFDKNTEMKEKFISNDILDGVKTLREEVASRMKELESYLPIDEGEGYLDEKGRYKTKNKVMVSNAAYGGTMESSLICVRSLVVQKFIDQVSRAVGRPLTVHEQLYASQELSQLTGTMKECAYCYVATDRRTYREMFGAYMKQYNAVYDMISAIKDDIEIMDDDELIKAFNTVDKNGKKKQVAKSKVKVNGAYQKAFFNFLKMGTDGKEAKGTYRSATKNMAMRFRSWVEDVLNGTRSIDETMLTDDEIMASYMKALEEIRETENEENTEDEEVFAEWEAANKKAWLVRDARSYAKSAAWPKSTTRVVNGKIMDYVAYGGSILNWTQDFVDKLNQEYGLRMYSFSDYVPAFLLEDMQMVTDASVRGLKMLAYTKDTGFAKVFEPTEMGINISVFGTWDKRTNTVVPDEMQGAKWAEAQAIREKSIQNKTGVGIVMVAYEDEMVEWAMNQDWIDVVIPYHLVRTGTEVAKYYGFTNYKAIQDDKKKKLAKGVKRSPGLKNHISPVDHENNLRKYLAELDKNDLTARFDKWKDRPNYMKLVNETRLPYNEMKPVQPNFNRDDVMSELNRIPKEGVYGELQTTLDSEDRDELIQEYVKSSAETIKNGNVPESEADYADSKRVRNSSRKTINDLLVASNQNKIRDIIAENEADRGNLIDVSAEAIKDLMDVGKSNVDRRTSGVSGSARRRVKTIALGIATDLINRERIDFRGQRIGKRFEAIENISSLFMVARDPRFETFRTVYVKDGSIVATEAISSKLPAFSSALKKKTENETIVYLNKKVRRLGADSFYILHNHPSGDPKQSQEDLNVTRFYSQVKGFAGHIVIDHNKYTVSMPSGAVLSGNTDVKNLPSFRKPVVNHSSLFRRISNADDVAGIGIDVVHSEKTSALIIADSDLSVIAIYDIPNDIVNSNNFLGYVKNRKMEIGGARAFLCTKSVSVFNSTNAYEGIKKKYFDDVVNVSSLSALRENVSPNDKYYADGFTDSTMKKYYVGESVTKDYGKHDTFDIGEYRYSLRKNPNAQVGINVNDSTQEFTDQIFDEKNPKTIETRDVMKNGKGPLDKYIGQRVGIVRTGKGKATVVGYVTIAGKVEYNTEKEFWKDRDKHKIRKKTNPTYYWNGKKKVGYILENPVKLDVKDQYEVYERGIVARDVDPYVNSPYYSKDIVNDKSLYSWNFLTNLPNQIVSVFPDVPNVREYNEEIGKQKVSRSKVHELGMKNEEMNAEFGDGNNWFVRNRYTKRLIKVSKQTIKHSIDGDFNRILTNARAGAIVGEIVKNGVPINGLVTTAPNASGTYALASYVVDSRNREFVAISTIEEYTNSIINFEIVDTGHNVNARQKNNKSTRLDTKSPELNQITDAYEISIAELLSHVKDTFQSILSDDVLRHYGITERPSGYYTGRTLHSTRENLDAKQQKNYDFNEKQTETGSKLKTLNGSDIARNKAHGLGKLIGGTIYFHKSYVDEFIGKSEYQKALDALHEYDPDFKFNGIRYDITQNVKGSVNPHFHQISFQEAPGFDTEREPIVGRTINVEPDGTVWESKNGRNTIWHHKWIWVRNDYTGFDVNESWEWSKEWLSVLTEPSNGSNTENWNKQLDKYGLPHDSKVRYSNRNEQTITSEDTSLNQTPSTFTNFLFNSNDRILDYGGGKYDTAKLAMESTYPGITIEVYDPYNRTEAHNERILSYFKKEKANVVTINNVLNVINSTDAIEDVIKGAKEYLASDGVAYIAIYEGNGSGVGAETSSGYQNNAKAGWYVQFAEKYFRYVKKSGTFILCSDSPITSVNKIDSATKSVLNGNTAKFKKEKKNMKDSLYSSRDNKGNRIYTQSDIDKLTTKYMGILIAERAKNDANLAAVEAEAKAKIAKMKFASADELKTAKAEMREKILVERAKKDASYAAIMEDMRLKAKERAEKQIERSNQRVREVRESGKRKVSRMKESALRAKYREKVRNTVFELTKWYNGEKKNKRVPVTLRESLGFILSSIDMSSRSLLNGGDPTKADRQFEKAMRKIREIAVDARSANESLANGTDTYGQYIDLPDGFAEAAQEIENNVSRLIDVSDGIDFVFNKMNSTELRVLNEMLKVLKKSITQMNDLIGDANNRKVSDLGDEFIGYASRIGKRKDSKFNGVSDFMNFTNATPYYAMKRFGSAGEKVFKAFMDGQDKLAFLVKKIDDFTSETYTEKELKEWRKTEHTFNIPIDEEGNVKTIRMTVPQIMELYELMKRDQAVGHILGGGIRIADYEMNGKTVRQTEGTTVTNEDVQNIVSVLTDRQIEVADKLQQYMEVIGSSWGNEVTMARWGIEGFGESGYYPIKSDENGIPTDGKSGQKSMTQLINMGFTHALIAHANNQITISDAFTTFSGHMADMARYNALALPVLNAYKWYSYKFKTSDTGYESVMKSMESAFGKAGKGYFTKLMDDINGTQSTSREPDFWKKMVSKYKVAAVAANIRVALLQPTSYLRAMNVINPKYLAAGLSGKNGYQELLEHSGTALWKSYGGYDTDVTRNIEDMVEHNGGWKEKIVELSGKGAEFGDNITWGWLWNAVKAEMKYESKLEYGTDEYWKAASERFREIVYSTQVMDSVLTRSQIMRDKSGISKSFTAFMSEPTLSMNMVSSVFAEWGLDARASGKWNHGFAKYGKAMSRATATYLATAALSSIVEGLVDALRYADDDDDDLKDNILEEIWDNFLDDINPLMKIPFVKDVWDMAEPTLKAMLTGTKVNTYYTNGRTDMSVEGISNLFKSFNSTWNALASGKSLGMSDVKKALQAGSQLTGLPMYNAFREINTVKNIWNHTIGESYSSMKID